MPAVYILGPFAFIVKFIIGVRRSFAAAVSTGVVGDTVAASICRALLFMVNQETLSGNVASTMEERSNETAEEDC